MKLSIVGLGKLGLCTAACFASKGHEVIGVEKNAEILDALARKTCPIPETGLETLLESVWSNFSVTQDAVEAAMHSDVSMIIVPTPSLQNDRFSNEYIEQALRDMAPAIKEKTRFHVIDIVSTVMPGSCRKKFKPLLEGLTAKNCGSGFGLVYNPEFIALGSILHNFMNPDLVLIGESDPKSGKQVETLYRTTCDNTPHIARMSLTSAEIAKLSINCYVTMKISFANELSSVVECVDDADIDMISAAMGADSRIGRKYLKSGLGFGGPCFPRDNFAFQAFAKEFGVDTHLIPQIPKVNQCVLDRLYKKIVNGLETGSKVALFGIAYKPNTPIVEESQSILLAGKLTAAGYQVAVTDPQAMETARKILGESVTYTKDPYEAAIDADTIALLTPWQAYENIDWQRIRENASSNVVFVDAWRLLSDKLLPENRYRALGLSQGENQ